MREPRSRIDSKRVEISMMDRAWAAPFFRFPLPERRHAPSVVVRDFGWVELDHQSTILARSGCGGCKAQQVAVYRSMVGASQFSRPFANSPPFFIHPSVAHMLAWF